MPLVDAKQLWCKAQAVCFDVDSTVITTEGIDELATFAGVDVSEITNRAMNGGVKFEDALEQRLRLINPSVGLMSQLNEKHPSVLSPHVQELVQLLQRRGVVVYLVSGGMKTLILPVAAALCVPDTHVIANVLRFNSQGEYVDFDRSVPTSHDGGKAEAVAAIKAAHGFSPLVMIGDGSTDMQARPPADLFIGYGGNQVRESVRQGCDWWVTDFSVLVQALQDKEKP